MEFPWCLKFHQKVGWNRAQHKAAHPSSLFGPITATSWPFQRIKCIYSWYGTRRYRTCSTRPMEYWQIQPILFCQDHDNESNQSINQSMIASYIRTGSVGGGILAKGGIGGVPPPRWRAEAWREATTDRRNKGANADVIREEAAILN